MNDTHLQHRIAVLLLIFLLLPLFMVSHTRANASASRVYLPVVLQPHDPVPPPTATPIPSAVSANDTSFAVQWALQKIRAPEGWGISTGKEVIVAVVDTGVDYNHPDLDGRMVSRGYWRDFANGDADPMDGNGHGTHVAGIAAASSNNGLGIAGISWGAKILPLKVLSDDGSGSVSLLSGAIEYAVSSGARVINMSLGGLTQPSRALQYAIDMARARGVVFIASAGNCHEGALSPYCGGQNDPISYPAAMPGVIAVAATNVDDRHASYSTVADYVDIAAPGSSVLSTLPLSVKPDGYGTLSGTSMAAPHVAGVAALVIGERPDLSPDDVERIIKSSAVDLGAPGWDGEYGAGRVDAYAALSAALGWTPQSTVTVEVQAAEVEEVPLATDCQLEHASNRILVRRSVQARAAMTQELGNVPHRVLQEPEGWQAVEVPEGRACEMVQALNGAGYGDDIAELDLTYLVPEVELLFND